MMKAFAYNGAIYVRLVPSKPLFRSTMVHEVVNRGDVFAMRLTDQMLTVVPGTADVVHFELPVDVTTLLGKTAQYELFDQMI
jgi:hypothetical protein